MNIVFTSMEKGDWISVAEIYRQGIESWNATFQRNIPTWNELDSGHIKTCRIVASIDNEIAGWASLTSVSGRCVYTGYRPASSRRTRQV